MITVRQRGDFKKLDRCFERLLELFSSGRLDAYGKVGVQALYEATPKRTGLTASSWTYEVVRRGGEISLVWDNTNVQSGEKIAVLIQYGHGTGWHTYVQGRDYINPAMAITYEQIAESIREEVAKA